MNSFTSTFLNIFNTDSDAKYTEKLVLRKANIRTPFMSEHFLKADLLLKLIVETSLL